MRPLYVILHASLLVTLAFVGHARAGCGVGRVGEMPLTLFHTRLFVPMTVNDTAGNFLLDTGAFHSVIDTGFAARVGVHWDTHQPLYTIGGFGGDTLPVKAGHMRMLGLAGMTVPDREMPLHDFGQPPPGAPSFDGILGADLLDLFDVELDFTASKLTLWRLQDCQDITPLHWSGDYAAIPMKRDQDKHLDIPIWLDGADLTAILDTGAGGLLLSHHAALQAGATEDQLAHDPLANSAGLGGSFTRRKHLFHILLIGKDELHDVTALVSNASAHDGFGVDHIDALVGLHYLLGHRVWLSYGTETLFLQKAP